MIFGIHIVILALAIFVGGLVLKLNFFAATAAKKSDATIEARLHVATNSSSDEVNFDRTAHSTEKGNNNTHTVYEEKKSESVDDRRNVRRENIEEGGRSRQSPRENIIFRNMYPPQDLPVNSLHPVSFENDRCAGKVLLMVRPSSTSTSSSSFGTWPHRDHFEGRRRLFELQVQLRLKKIPQGHVVMGGQLREPMTLGFIMRSIAYTLLKVVQKLFPGGGKLHYSFGSKTERPHIMFPFRQAVAAMVITSKGEQPPRLGGDIEESAIQRKQRRSGVVPSWSLDDTYTFAMHTYLVDLNTLKVVGLGVGNVDLQSFWGQSIAEICAYSLPPTIKRNVKVHTEDVKAYLFRFSVERIDDSVRSVGETTTAGMKEEEEEEEEEEGNGDGMGTYKSSTVAAAVAAAAAAAETGLVPSAVAWIEVPMRATKKIPDRFIICDDKGGWTMKTWSSLCDSFSRLSSVQRKALTRNRRLRVRQKQLDALQVAMMLVPKRKSTSAHAAIFERVEGPPLLKFLKKYARGDRSSSSETVPKETPAILLQSSTHWIQGILELERKTTMETATTKGTQIGTGHDGVTTTTVLTRRKNSFRLVLRTQDGQSRWERSADTFIKTCRTKIEPTCGLFHFEVACLGRVFVFGVSSEKVADDLVLLIRNAIHTIERDRPNEMGWAVDAIFDPREVFLERSFKWRGGRRLLLNARRRRGYCASNSSSPIANVALDELSAKLLESAVSLSNRFRSPCVEYVEHAMGAEPRTTSEKNGSWSRSQQKAAGAEFLAFMDAISVLRTVRLGKASPSSKKDGSMSPATSFAFWTNLYHVLLVHTTLLLGPPLKSWKLQTEMCYEIGGQPFSLVEIEHCILRAKSSRPRAALAKFFLPKCLKGDDPRWLAAQKVPVEPRLNFVLNSGSTSCPGRIPVFRGNDLDAQLDTTSALFLSDNVHVDVASRRVVLPTIMSWYKNDFAESRRAPNRVSKITCATFVARLLDRDKNRASQDATRGLRRDLALVLQSTKGLKISYGEYDWKAPRNTFEPLNFS